MKYCCYLTQVPEVLDLVLVHDAPKSDDVELVEKAPLKKVWRTVWAMLCVDDARIVWRNSGNLARMMAVVVESDRTISHSSQTGP